MSASEEDLDEEEEMYPVYKDAVDRVKGVQNDGDNGGDDGYNGQVGDE